MLINLFNTTGIAQRNLVASLPKLSNPNIYLDFLKPLFAMLIRASRAPPPAYASICFSDLARWAFEVANGMSYISRLQVSFQILWLKALKLLAIAVILPIRYR